MSAYGAITSKTANVQLKPREFSTAREGTTLTVFHLRANELPADLTSLLRDVFNQVVEEGKTYPQEISLNEDEFRAYYLSYDLFLGVLRHDRKSPDADGQEVSVTLDHCKGARTWHDCVAGMYYVKPNYPGRSSHASLVCQCHQNLQLKNRCQCCNAGFIVRPVHRGLKLGMALGRSYLHFAPKLGYRASVFNLVYVTNKASLKIWDNLGFQRAGLIPQAGRLKLDKDQEEYVDAVVYYKALI